MKVLKFGGSSVSSAKNIQQVISIVSSVAEIDNVVLVVSAFGKTTNGLIATANLAKNKDKAYKAELDKIQQNHIDIIKELIPENNEAVVQKTTNLFSNLGTLYEGCFLLEELSDKALAIISSFGEQLSSYIISEAAKLTIDAVHKDSRELIVTNDNFLKAQVDFEQTYSNCIEFFNNNEHTVTVAPGFIARCTNGQTTTLGRGGSDYTAAIYCAAINADELQIWTDVSGMYTANPSIVKNAYPIEHISYQEAMEMSHFGAKVIYPPTIQPVMEQKTPVLVKNTFAPDEKGTLITVDTEDQKTVKGISYVENIALLSLQGSGMVGVSGVAKRLFETLSDHDINVILITQASSEHSICIAIYEEDAEKAVKKINEKFSLEISQSKIEPVSVETGLSIIAIVGDNMKNHQGLSGKMFSALGKNNVSIRAIAQGASERNISAVISGDDSKKALNTLHEEFFEDETKQLNLFVTGVGNVGSDFLNQIRQQQEYLRENLKLNIRVIGLTNSKKMIFDENGLDLNNWKELIQDGEPTSLEGFLEKTKSFNLRNSVFIDNTASAKVSEVYEHYLRSSIAIVTCNKIACASQSENYQNLKRLSRKYNAPFLFETNVGAGLPIIDTLKHLITSGDRIHKIQAVLSGTLNFVFNEFNDTNTFHDVVAAAQAEGYTEPDPKIDLSGVDVARKILILARESGYELELTDVENKDILPQKSLDTTSIEDFYASLKEFEATFQELYKEAAAKDCRLKYVAELSEGKATVGLQHIPQGHPFYNLEGSDNIVLFFTDRYPTQPLQIKGAGAGAAVTASGIFADVIRVSNN